MSIKFQPLYRETNSVVPTAGEVLFTGEGEMFLNVDGTPRPHHSVHTVEDLATLYGLSGAYLSEKRIYRVGNDLYRWLGTDNGDATDWSLMTEGFETMTSGDVQSLIDRVFGDNTP